MRKRTCAVAVIILFCILASVSALTLEDVTTEGMNITVKGETLAVAPLKVSSVKKELKLKEGTPGWRGPVFTPGTSWRYAAMTKGSLKASSGENVLKEGTDYLVDYAWGTLGAPRGSTYVNQDVTVEYTYTASRLDLVVEKGGKLEVVKGKPDSRKPVLPKTPEGAEPVFSVYIPHNTTSLTKEHINIIDLSVKPYAESTGREFIKAQLEKLASGKAFTIAFLGDSITAQTDPQGGGFVERFKAWAEKKYTKVKYVRMKRNKKGDPVNPAEGEVAIVMAGVGGDTTVKGLKRLEDHVLVHKPDLVFIMFGVNDENKRGKSNVVPLDQYEKNLTELVTKLRAGKAEPVLMTTSMKNLGWSATAGNLNEYAARARKVAEANKVCLIDHFKAWEDLPKMGYNYMIPLGSCINHPNDMGHEMFFQAIRALIEGK